MIYKQKHRFESFPERPSNYVLWCDGLDFHVSRRIGTKFSCECREHFVGFFASRSDAWRVAELKTLSRIQTLKNYIRRFKSARRSTSDEPK